VLSVLSMKGRGRRRGWRWLWVAGGLIVTVLAVGGLLARYLSARFLPGLTVTPELQIRLPSDRLFTLGEFPVTNTLLASWLATLLLLGFFLAAQRHSRLVPRGLQNVSEALLDALLGLVAAFSGKQGPSWLFPLGATIFLFIAANALVALLPIFGPVAAVRTDGSHAPLFRGAGTDINMSLALALVVGAVVEASGFMALWVAYLGTVIRVGHLRRGHLALGAIDLFLGLLSAAAQVFRLLSFTFRLFGNLTAGEIIVLTGSVLFPLVLGVPFYGMEVLIGLVQAGIFAGLTVLFVTMAQAPEALSPQALSDEEVKDAPRSGEDRGPPS
jgi:F-type H+-transporting ATPase subunit a